MTTDTQTHAHDADAELHDTIDVNLNRRRFMKAAAAGTAAAAAGGAATHPALADDNDGGVTAADAITGAGLRFGPLTATAKADAAASGLYHAGASISNAIWGDEDYVNVGDVAFSSEVNTAYQSWATTRDGLLHNQIEELEGDLSDEAVDEIARQWENGEDVDTAREEVRKRLSRHAMVTVRNAINAKLFPLVVAASIDNNYMNDIVREGDDPRDHGMQSVWNMWSGVGLHPDDDVSIEVYEFDDDYTIPDTGISIDYDATETFDLVRWVTGGDDEMDEEHLEDLEGETFEAVIPAAEGGVDEDLADDDGEAINEIPLITFEAHFDDGSTLEFTLGDVLDDGPTGSFSMEFEGETVYPDIQNTTPVVWEENEDADDDEPDRVIAQPSRRAYAFNELRNALEDIQGIVDSVVETLLTSGFIDNLYEHLNAGDLAPEQLRSPRLRAALYSGDSDVQSADYAIALAAQSGIGIEIADVSHVQGDFTGATNLESFGDGVVPSETQYTDVSGIVFADEFIGHPTGDSAAGLTPGTWLTELPYIGVGSNYTLYSGFLFADDERTPDTWDTELFDDAEEDYIDEETVTAIGTAFDDGDVNVIYGFSSGALMKTELGGQELARNEAVFGYSPNRDAVEQIIPLNDGSGDIFAVANPNLTSTSDATEIARVDGDTLDVKWKIEEDTIGMGEGVVLHYTPGVDGSNLDTNKDEVDVFVPSIRDTTLKLWDAETGEVIEEVESASTGDTYRMNGTIRSDGEVVLAGRNDDLDRHEKVESDDDNLDPAWEETGSIHNDVSGGTPTGLQFIGEDGNLVAGVQEDYGSTTLWDAETGEVIAGTSIDSYGYSFDVADGVVYADSHGTAVYVDETGVTRINNSFDDVPDSAEAMELVVPPEVRDASDVQGFIRRGRFANKLDDDHAEIFQMYGALTITDMIGPDGEDASPGFDKQEFIAEIEETTGEDIEDILEDVPSVDSVEDIDSFQDVLAILDQVDEVDGIGDLDSIDDEDTVTIDEQERYTGDIDDFVAETEKDEEARAGALEDIEAADDDLLGGGIGGLPSLPSWLPSGLLGWAIVAGAALLGYKFITDD